MQAQHTSQVCPCATPDSSDFITRQFSQSGLDEANNALFQIQGVVGILKDWFDYVGQHDDVAVLKRKLFDADCSIQLVDLRLKDAIRFVSKL